MSLNLPLFLKQELSYGEFQDLYKTLGENKLKTTRLLTGVDEWDIKNIQKVAELLEEDPIDLILEHGLGRKIITLQQLDRMISPRGLKVGVIANVA